MESRTEQIMQAIRRKLDSGTIAAGEKLPSIRGFAATMQVSPSTVVEAYDRLAAEGVIHARSRSGFFAAQGNRPVALSAMGPRLDREVDPLWVSRQSLDAEEATPKPGCGWLPADWMPVDSLRRAIRAAGRADDGLLSYYGGTRSEGKLRQLLSRQLSDQGIEVGPDRILLTSSGSNAVDLVCRLLLSPGDKVLVDDPCYFNFQALFRAHRVEVVGVPYTPQGPDLARFEEALSHHKPRLYITNSALHNPTGATITAQIAHKLLTLAAAHDLIVIEDDIFAEFEPDLSPRLAAMDGLDRVIRIGSFSKTLSASVRCGYVAARPDWIEALIDLQVATNFGGPSPLAAEILHHALTDGGYRKHMEALRARLAGLRWKVAVKLGEIGITPWIMPRGGFYLWCQLPEGTDSIAMARAALAQDIVLAPGNVFSPSQGMTSYMRFNVGQMGHPGIYPALDRAMRSAA